MYVFISILLVLIAVALIFIITIQNPKGGGLASGFSASNNIMGVRRATDMVEKITWGLAIALGVLAVLITHWAPTHTSTAPATVIQDYVDQATIPAPVDAQPFGNMPAPEGDATSEGEVPVTPITTPEAE